VAAHLAECSTCAAEYRTLHELSGWADAGAAVIAPATSGVRAGKPRFVPPYAWLAAAAVLVAATGVVITQSTVWREAASDGGPEPSRTRAVTSRGPLVVLRPRGAQTGPPESFEWQPVPGASGYQVEVFSEDGTPLWTSPLLVTTRAERPATLSLAPGRYYWRVRANAAGSIASESTLVEFDIR
jgi:hypothetical protein